MTDINTPNGTLRIKAVDNKVPTSDMSTMSTSVGRYANGVSASLDTGLSVITSNSSSTAEAYVMRLGGYGNKREIINDTLVGYCGTKSSTDTVMSGDGSTIVTNHGLDDEVRYYRSDDGWETISYSTTLAGTLSPCVALSYDGTKMSVGHRTLLYQVELYEFNGTVLVQQDTIDVPTSRSIFGMSMSADGSRLIVSAYQYSNMYLYHYTISGGALTYYTVSSGGYDTTSSLEIYLSFSGNTIIFDNGTNLYYKSWNSSTLSSLPTGYTVSKVHRITDVQSSRGSHRIPIITGLCTDGYYRTFKLGDTGSYYDVNDVTVINAYNVSPLYGGSVTYAWSVPTSENTLICGSETHNGNGEYPITTKGI